jgi:pimeloyl-ACP methyl ester carboxylesterase
LLRTAGVVKFQSTVTRNVRKERSSSLPVYFMLGRHDWEVPSVISARYFDALTAPQKQLFWFEQSGHLPNSEERRKFNGILVDVVRASLPLSA